MRRLAMTDPFFLLTKVLHRPDANNEWVYQQTRLYFRDPWDHLDLWPREHYKSTITTFCGIIFWIINDPESTHGIFSFNRGIAKGFLKQIKQELENNQLLKDLFPDIFWQNPEKDASKWSEDEGLCVKRRTNPIEQTVEAWGVTDGQPTSRHFTHLHYDDLVTDKTVSTPEQIEKTTEGTRLSFNLGRTIGGHKSFRGTRYHYADTYNTLIEDGVLIPRIYAATKDGTLEGEPWFWTREMLMQKIKDQGPKNTACQLFNNPSLSVKTGFIEANFLTWQARHFGKLNIYILVDPANTKNKKSDYTVMIVLGLGSDRNYYVIDWYRDRMELSERTNLLFRLVRDYQPKKVGYEQYGMQSDIAHIRERQDIDNFRFRIDPIGGKVSKADRINTLEPLYRDQRIYVPETCIHENYEHEKYDATKVFKQSEYLRFPYCEHDDMLDCLARINDDKFSMVFPDQDGKTDFDPYGAFTQRERDQKGMEAYNPLTYGL